MNSCTFFSKNSIKDIISKFDGQLREKFGSSVSYDSNTKKWTLIENAQKITLIAIDTLIDVQNTQLERNQIQITFADKKLNQTDIKNILKSADESAIDGCVFNTGIDQVLSSISIIADQKLTLFQPLVNLDCNSNLSALTVELKTYIKKEVLTKELASQISSNQVKSEHQREITEISNEFANNQDIETIIDLIIKNNISIRIEVIFNKKSYYIPSKVLFEAPCLQTEFNKIAQSGLEEKKKSFTFSETGQFSWNLNLNLPFQFFAPMLQAMEINAFSKTNTSLNFKNWTVSYLILAYVGAHHYGYKDLKEKLLHTIPQKTIASEEEYEAIKNILPHLFKIFPSNERKKEDPDQKSIIFSLLLKYILSLDTKLLDIKLNKEVSFYKEYEAKISSLSFIANKYQSKPKLDLAKVKSIIPLCPNARSLDIKGYIYNIYDMEKFIKNNQFDKIEIDGIIFDKNNISEDQLYIQLYRLWNKSTNLQNKTFPLQLNQIIDFIRKEVISPFNPPPGILSDTSTVIKLLGKKLLKFKNLPNELQDNFDIALAAVQQDGKNIRFIGNTLKNSPYLKNLIIAALTQNGMALQYVGINAQNDIDLVKIAYNQNNWSLQFAHIDIIEEMVRENGNYLEFVGKTAQNKLNIVELAYNQNEQSLQFAGFGPIYEIVKNNGMALQFAGKEAQDNKEIANIAYDNLENSIQYASRRMVLDILEKKNGNALQHTKQEIKNDIEAVKLAYRNNPNSLQYASDDVVNKLLSENGMALNYAKLEIKQDLTSVLIAYEQNPASLQFACLPNNITKDAIKLNVRLLREDGMKLNDLHLSLRKNFYMISIAYEQNPESLQFASKEFVLKKLSEEGESLKYVNHKFKDDLEIVLTAYRQDKKSLQHASKAIQKRINDDYASLYDLEALEDADDSIIQKIMIETDDSIIEKIIMEADKKIFDRIISIFGKNTKIVTIAYKRDKNFLQYLDFSVIKEIVNSDPNALEFAGQEIQGDIDIVSEAYKKKPKVLQHATLSVTREIIDKNWTALKDASQEAREDLATVLIAYDHDEKAIEFATDSIQSKIKEEIALLKNQNGMNFKKLSPELQNSYRIILLAYSLDPKSLQFVNKIATKKKLGEDGEALEYVESSFKKDKEMVQIAYNQKKASLRHADLSVIREILENDPRALKFAGKEAQEDIATVLIAYEKNKEASQFAASFIKSSIEMLEKDGMYLQKLSSIFQDNNYINRVAYEQNPKSLQFANKNFVESILKEDGQALKYVSLAFKNDIEMVRFAYESYNNEDENKKKVLQHADLSVIRRMLKTDGRILQFAGEAAQKDIIAAFIAFRQNKDSLQFAHKTCQYDINHARDSIEKHPMSLKKLHKRFKYDITTVKNAFEKNPKSLQFAALSIIRLIIKENGKALEFAGKKAQKDLDTVLIAYANDENSLAHADLSVIRKIVKEDGMALKFAGEKAQKDLTTVGIASEQNKKSLKFAQLSSSSLKDLDQKSLFSRISQAWKMKWS